MEIGTRIWCIAFGDHMGKAEAMKWWWLTFYATGATNGDRFRGAALIQAPDNYRAVQTAQHLGIHPGGWLEVETEEFAPDVQPIESYAGRLLSSKECDEFDREMMAREAN